MRIEDIDAKSAAFSSAFLVGAVVLILGYASETLIQPGLDSDVFIVNIIQHFIGVFCISAAFYLQFSPRLKHYTPKLDFDFIPDERPRKAYVIGFFVMGASYTLSSVRLIVPTRDLGLTFETWGVIIAATFFVLLFMGVIAFETRSKKLKTTKDVEDH